MSRKHIFFFCLIWINIHSFAQHHYVCYDQSIFGLKTKSPQSNGRFLRYEGIQQGGSIQFSCDKTNQLGIGMNLSTISYEKEWKGIFPESNEFGWVQVNGKLKYWSFPVSYNWLPLSGPRSYFRCGGYRREKFHFGFSITYIPSFLAQSTYRANTMGGADLNTFLSTFQSNEQNFQQSLTLALSDQFLMLDKHLRLDVEPYVGIGSGYFKESGAHLTTVIYGLKLRVGLWSKLPTLEIEREVNRGNEEQKKKELEKKQKEIEEKLKQNTNPN